MNELFKLLGSIGIDTGEANKKIDETVNKAKTAANKMANSFGSISKESGSMAGKIATGLGAVAVAVGSFSIKAAGDMRAMNSQFSQVFGDLESTAKKNVNGMAKEFNMVPNRIKPMFSKMTSMFMGLGMDTKQAMGEAEKATRLTADAAAFYDTSFENANASLSSFIKGNYEGGESIGIFANDTQMAAYAIKQGVVSSTAEWQKLDEATKQATRLEYAQNMQKLGGVTGQAAREAKGMENVMGNLKQGAKDLAAAFGAPILDSFLNAVNAVANGMSKLAGILESNPALVYAIIGAVTTLVAAFGAVYLAADNFAKVKAGFDVVKIAIGAMANPVFLVVAAIGALVTAFVYFYNTSKPFKAFIDELIPKLRDGLGSAIDFVQDAFKRVANFMSANVMPIIEKLGGAFGAFGTFAGVAVSALSKIGLAALGITGPWGIAAGAIVSFLTSWAKTGELNTDGIQQVFDGLSSMITNVSGLITQYLPTIVATGTKILTSLIDGIVQALPSIINAVLAIINSLVTTLTTLLPQIISAGIQILTALINGITQALPQILTAVMTIITALVGALVLLLPQIINAGIQILMALINGIISMMPAIIDAALSLIMTLANALIANLPKIIDAGIKLLNALINGIMQILPQLIAAGLKLIITVANALIANLPKIIDAGVKLLTSLVNGIVKMLPQLISTALTLVVKLAGALIKNAPQILAAGVKLIKSLVSGIGQMVGQVISAGAKLGTSLINKLKSFSLKGAAVNLVKGFANGISSMVSSVVKAAQNLGKKAVGAVKSFLHIHSPSRVMMEIGAFTGEGFANGIENMQDQVQKASDSLAESALIDPTLNDETLARTFDVKSNAQIATKQNDLDKQTNWQGMFENLMGLLEQYLPVIATEKAVVLDSGETVGALKDKFNAALGRDAVYGERGGI